ncbi:hypothetical protein RSOLAG1IB_10560 [Rhizoctonia solani AG-1 IB]|uniref:Uncharacterized protein n=1 Tax=Thanatephorus cucumeris (strain AG1-IB / isolate 7/3/14) TaxID=1108050 RepID=A0A0B7G350_THACB|nr:hypothetical protein RSOLAG1IB_10560 [Rhizoctonia solani AG-1 IB]
MNTTIHKEDSPCHRRILALRDRLAQSIQRWCSLARLPGTPYQAATPVAWAKALSWASFFADLMSIAPENIQR